MLQKLTIKGEQMLLQQVKMLDSNCYENIVDIKLKMHAYLFFVFDFNEKFKTFSNICVFVFSFDKNKNVKIKKMVQAELYLKKLKKINFDIWPN